MRPETMIQFPTIADSVVMQFDHDGVVIGNYMLGRETVVISGKTLQSNEEHLRFHRAKTRQHLLADAPGGTLSLRRFSSAVENQTPTDPAQVSRLQAALGGPVGDFVAAKTTYQSSNGTAWQVFSGSQPPTPSVHYMLQLGGHTVDLSLRYTVDGGGARHLSQMRWFIQADPASFQGDFKDRLPLDEGTDVWTMTPTATSALPNLQGWHCEAWDVGQDRSIG